ncbi:MAG: hypothetical protein J6N95_04805 [Bacilli bacterium]|nr:hypothetical protein [Bacilli bacterium]
MEKKHESLKIFFGVLLFGGLWGILEATLGSFLHLPFMEAAGMYACSTTIMVPLAYMCMGACYKRTGVARSSIYMGLMAAGIKAIVCAIFGLKFNPVYYILMEALVGAIALFVMKPKELISFKGLGTFIIANTVYLVVSTFIRVDLGIKPVADFVANLEKYALTLNCIAILYVFIAGLALYGLKKLAEVKEWKFEGLKKIIYSPITAASVAAVMMVVTFVLR